MNAGQLKNSHQLCLQILEQQRNHPEAHYLLGMNAFLRKDLKRAETLLKRAIDFDHTPLRFYLYLCRTYLAQQNQANALNVLHLANTINTENPHEWDTLGVLNANVNQHRRALMCFQKAVQREPKNTEYLYNLATSSRINGQLDEAIIACKQIITLQPNFYRAYSLMAQLRKATQDANHIALLERQLTLATDTTARLHFSHALFLELESLNNYEKAFHYLEHGKTQQKTTISYDLNWDLNLFKTVQELCNKNFLENRSEVRVPRGTRQPIFVLGMPRSGTTLLDRILSNHSQIESLGERLDFPIAFKQVASSPSKLVLDEATIQQSSTIDYSQLGQNYYHRLNAFLPNSAFFIDKLPLNFFYIGYIYKALPHAKIIVLQRNPLDLCISNYKQLFAANFSYYNYAYDLKDCARYIVEFHRLMDHWRNLIPKDRLIEVQYENLVSNTEQEAKRAVEFINLPWQENCLHFDKNTAPVATASATQVRQPIYHSSVGAWRNYEFALDEVKSLFDEAGIAYQ